VDEMEDLLKGYRPIGPPAALRARVTALGGGEDWRAPIAGWLLVAATLICALLFYGLAAREHQRIALRMPAPIVEESRNLPVESWE
jgi:hypothetical protein